MWEQRILGYCDNEIKCALDSTYSDGGGELSWFTVTKSSRTLYAPFSVLLNILV